MMLSNLKSLVSFGSQRLSVLSPVKLQMTFHNLKNLNTAPVRLANGKESMMKFEVGKSADQYIAKRNEKGLLSKFAREQGGDAFSNVVGMLFICGMLIIAISPTVLIPGRIADFYEHPETVEVKKDENIVRRRMQMMKYKHYICPRVDELFEQVMVDLGVDQKKRKLATLFSSDTFNPIWYGSLTTKCGFLMGVPHYIEYSNVHEVVPSELRHKPIFSFVSNALSVDEIVVTEDNEEDFRALLETFVLSENAKKFMIASKVSLATSSVAFFFNVLSIPVTFSAMAVILSKLNEVNEMFKKPLGLRLLLYFFGYAGVVLTVKPSRTFLEEDYVDYADRKVYKLGRDYLEGGIEYYTKTIARGKLFRKLHPKGSLYFNEDGDPIPFWFEPEFTEKTKTEARLQFALECQKNEKELQNSCFWNDKILSW